MVYSNYHINSKSLLCVTIIGIPFALFPFIGFLSIHHMKLPYLNVISIMLSFSSFDP